MPQARRISAIPRNPGRPGMSEAGPGRSWTTAPRTDDRARTTTGSVTRYGTGRSSDRSPARVYRHASTGWSGLAWTHRGRQRTRACSATCRASRSGVTKIGPTTRGVGAFAQTQNRPGARVRRSPRRPNRSCPARGWPAHLSPLDGDSVLQLLPDAPHGHRDKITLRVA